MTAPLFLRLCGRVIELGRRPLLMGIVNATPDSFSDAGHPADPEALLDAGADLIDVGGETASGHRPVVPAEEEIARVVPVISRLAARGVRCPWTRTSLPWRRPPSKRARCS